MGTMCSCARSDRAHSWLHGRSASFADVYLSGRKFDIRIVRENGEVATITSATPASYPVPLEYVINECDVSANDECAFHVCTGASRTTLAESGIDSHNSSYSHYGMENHLSRSAALSAPTTPYAIRQKPPPKPPRMRQYSFDGGVVNGIAGNFSPGNYRTLPARRSDAAPSLLTSQLSTPTLHLGLPPESPGATSAASSFNFGFGGLEANSVLDMSFNSTQELQPVSRIYPANTAEKVYNILQQTKDFLVYEMDIDVIIPSLLEKGVLDTRAVTELNRMSDRIAACESLLETLMHKSHPDFVLFCDTLKHRARCPNLADLLLALDSLVDLGAEDSVKKRQSLTEETAASFEKYKDLEPCPICAKQCHNDPDDFLTDTTNFDVEILYIDKETGQNKALKDVVEIKKQKLETASAGRDQDSGSRASLNQNRTNSATSALAAELVKHEADKYIPVLTVSLYNYCLWHEGMDKITRAISKRTCVRELSLSKCHLGTQSVRKLSQALYQTGVYKLDLRLNSLTDDAFKELADGLKRITSVKVVNLSSTDLSAESFRLLLQSICRNQSTQELDVGFNDLQDAGCDVMAEILTINCPLRKLRIRDNGIVADGAYRLFKALKKNSRLTLLDISSNAICNYGNNSLVTLSEMLRYNRTLKQLNVENCSISHEGCTALARALKSNTVLRTLDMSMNPVKDAGVEALSEGLKYNQVLDTLCLNMCSITNVGFGKLLDALQFNMSLKTLKMCYNKIGRSGETSSSPPSSNNSTLDLSLNTQDSNPKLSPSCSASDNATLNASQNSLSTGMNGNISLSSKDVSLKKTTVTIEEVYDKLCQVLQQNKDLKVLLWGNKLEEDDCEMDAGSELERAIVHSDANVPISNHEQQTNGLAASNQRNASNSIMHHSAHVLDTPSMFNSSLEVVTESASEYMDMNGNGHTVNGENQNMNGNQQYIGNSNGIEPVAQNVSKLNSLQRNFVQQYTIQNGHPSNSSHTKSLSVDLGSQNNPLKSTDKSWSNGQNISSPNTPSILASTDQHNFANHKPQKPTSINFDNSKPVSLDSGFCGTPTKAITPTKPVSVDVAFSTPIRKSMEISMDEFGTMNEMSNQSNSRLQVSPRMGTSVGPSPYTVTPSNPLAHSYHGLPSTDVAPISCHHPCHHALNGNSEGGKVVKDSFDYMSSSAPNCNGPAMVNPGILMNSSNSNSVMTNGGLMTTPTCSPLHHHTGIRTNGSLPRKPKRLHIETPPTTVSAGHPTVAMDTSTVNTGTVAMGNEELDDVFRPHTIPRRGARRSIIN